MQTAVRKKVLYVFGGEQASGAEIVMERLIHYNIDLVEPHIFIAPGSFAQSLAAAGKPYKIVQIEALRKLNRSSTGKLQFYKKAVNNHFSISAEVLRYTKENGIDIVHAITVVPASYCIPAIIKARLLRRKIRWVWSDYDIRHFAKLDHFFSWLCSRLFNITLAASNAVKNKYADEPYVQVLYNGLDINIFKPDMQARQQFRAEFGINKNVILFGIAGVISPRKGQLELLHAFSEATKNNTNAWLILAGGLGPDFKEYNEEVKAVAGALPNVTYIGHYPKMTALLNGCDVVINNSTAEGSEPLGTTIYEAMSCETLVAGSDTGGTPEIIEHGINGFLYNPDDKAALEHVILHIIKNCSLLDNVRKQARQKVKQKFDYRLMTTRYNMLLHIKNNTTKILKTEAAL